MSDYVFVSDEEVLERMQEFYESIIPAEGNNAVVDEPAPFRPVFDYSEEAVNGLFVVRTLLANPFLNYSALIKTTGLSKDKVKDAAKWLKKNGFVQEHEIPLGGKPGIYFEILPDALELLGGKAPAGRGGFQHKFYCHKIKDYFVAHGLDVYLEGCLQGMRGAFDLLAGKKDHRWFGVEVTLNFKNLVDNVRDGLKSSVDRIIIVTEKKKEEERAKRTILKEIGSIDGLEFKTVGEFK